MTFEINDGSIASTAPRDSSSEGAFLDMVRCYAVKLPAGDVAEPFVDAEDIADAAVAEAGHAGHIYEVTGPPLLTFAEAVGEIAHATGREIRYARMPREPFASEATRAGLPHDFAWLRDHLFATVLDGRNAYVGDGVQRALDRAPGDFTSYASGAAAKLVGSLPAARSVGAAA